MSTIREPAVAGFFYPGDADELSTTVQGFLDAVAFDPGRPPKALIVPHAGYVYSGPVAATAYARLRRHRDRYDRVVLLGPGHRVAFSGLALSGADAFRTPLGLIPVDRTAIADLGLPSVRTLDAAHEHEHSLEVHLPFLQRALGDFSLVPLVVGEATAEDVAEVLEMLWGDDATLLVVSSDLSHYLAYDQARERDRATCASIEALDAHRIGYRDACGAVPVGGLLIAARRRGLAVDTLDLRNSGDTAGDRRQVVGYGAWVFTAP